MNDDPLMNPARDEPPSDGHDPATPAAVIGGAILGVIGGIVLSFLSMSLASTIDSEFSAALLMFGVPVLVGVVLLGVPQLRRVGAGFVMGLGIGSVVSAGVCAAFMAYLSRSLGGG